MSRWPRLVAVAVGAGAGGCWLLGSFGRGFCFVVTVGGQVDLDHVGGRR